MIIVNGSRRNGNCYNLANRVKEELDKERIYCKIITPGNQKIHVCTGCMDCDKDGICDFTDDMKDNIEAIKNDDIIMFITPARWNLLSGDLKIFMDRLNPMYARGELKNKKMIAVAIGCKKKDYCSIDDTIKSLTNFCESSKMQLILQKCFYECLKEEDILKYEEEIKKLISDIKDKIKQ